jgi:hypothetical protein
MRDASFAELAVRIVSPATACAAKSAKATEGGAKMSLDILGALGALRDQVRRSLLDNPEFRALVSIEQSIAEIEEATQARAVQAHAQALAQAPVEAAPLSPPQPANIGRALYERAMAQAQPPVYAEQQPMRHAQPFLPTHKVA